MVGIKGTGMTALAEVLTSRGARVSGSDVADTFYTDAILERLGIPWQEGFSSSHLPSDARVVIHSAAYRREDNAELLEARRRGLPLLTYPEALGMLSERADSSGVGGVHGKSTTTALCGVILKAWKVPATVVVGTEVPAFGGRSTLAMGEDYLLAETCEYRRHFLNFHPRRMVITSVEPDHLDYFKDIGDILDAFEEYALLLPPGGCLVYCADDPGACAAARRIHARRQDLRAVPYGVYAEGAYRVTGVCAGNGETRFGLAGFTQEFTLRVPGVHTVSNAAAALALAAEIWSAWRGGEAPDIGAAREALRAFTGSRRRSEIIGEARGVLFLDDYAHHPTAIRKTLEGFRSFYPGRRLVVDFMSHTYSRTRALLGEFGECFTPADLVVLHRIYASAREAGGESVSGRDLASEVSRHHHAVRYFEEPADAAPFLAGELRSGDVFVTMGAGDNWKLGRELLRSLGGSP
jgi:UDP-N-acetylmuramate--alanine ligase